MTNIIVYIYSYSQNTEKFVHNKKMSVIFNYIILRTIKSKKYIIPKRHNLFFYSYLNKIYL